MNNKKLSRWLKRFVQCIFAIPLLTTWAASAAPPAPPEITLHIVGGLASGNRYSKLERPFWVSELPKLSGGRFAAEVVPYDRAGVPGQEMLRMMQLGVIPFGTALFSNIAAGSAGVERA